MSGSLTDTPKDELELKMLVTDPNDLTDVLHELEKQKHFASESKQAADRLTAQAVKLLNDMHTDHHVIASTVDGEKKTAKVIIANDTVVDVDKARQLLGQETLEKMLAPPKVSIESYEHLCETGEIPIEVAAQITTYKPKKATVRFFKAD